MTFNYGNILIQQYIFRFPRTPIGANIKARKLLLALGPGRDTRRGTVAASVAPVFQSNQWLNPHCDGATVKMPVPRVRARACAHACAHVAICLSWRRTVAAVIFFFSNLLKRKNKRPEKTGFQPRHLPRHFFDDCRGWQSLSGLIRANSLILNKIGGF